jgi:hypothetical protein
MRTFTLTPEQLTDLVDRAFELGKVYACDELDTCGINTPLRLFKSGQNFDNHFGRWIEAKGGYTLHSGEAKQDIILDVVKEQLRDLFPCD